tara:strand:- start:80581 stop:80823 length:243 start_codon:yes stop_codon:yes gene_type:complete
MKNFIIEDTEENLEALETIFPKLYYLMIGKVDEDEVLIASMKDGELVELEYWESGTDFVLSENAEPATLKELLEATNALN